MQAHPYQNLSQKHEEPWMSWLPVFFGLAVICMESTRTMGASHTCLWLQQIVLHFHMQARIENVPEMNHLLRKTGHFFGYGLLGLFFCRGWLAVLLQRMRLGRLTFTPAKQLQAACLAVLSVATVASLDEIHQSYLPGRGASISDVLLDTSGSLLLVTAFCVIRFVHARHVASNLAEVRSESQRRRHRELFLHALETLERSRTRN